MPRLRLEVDADGVAVVTLSNPPVNALGRALREELVTTIDALGDRDDVRVVVLTGEGRVFCAGADIKEKRVADASPGARMRADRLIRDAFSCVMECPRPVIAAINGPALGAGMVLATCCDVVLAAEGATFGMPEIDVGQGGGAAFLQRVLPVPVVRALLLTGERVPTAEMYRLGLVRACVSGAGLMDAALTLARTIAGKSPVAVRTLKTSFAAVGALPFDEGVRLERANSALLARTDDAREAAQAFVEKRLARFAGR